MSATLIESFDAGTILQPEQNPQDARQDALQFGANLTVEAGDLIGIKDSDGKAYLYSPSAIDGTENAVSIAMQDFATDANGKVYLGTSTASANVRVGPSQTAQCWVSGIFDPAKLKVSGTEVSSVQDVILAFAGLARKLHNGFVKVL